MTKIHRYIDDPPQFLIWDIDEVVIFAAFIGIGMMAGVLTIMIVIGIILSFLLKKIKQKASDGMLLHILYWYGIQPIKGCPPTYNREFIE